MRHAPRVDLVDRLPSTDEYVALSASVTGRTVRLSWTGASAATGCTVLARYTPSGPVIAAIPVRDGSTTLTVTGVPVGTYVVSVAGHGGGETAESETIPVVVVP